MSQLTFPEFDYTRPDLDRLEEAFQSVLTELRTAETLNDALAAVEQIDAIRASVATAYNIGYIRYSIDTRDEFYRGEKDWFDRHLPRTEQWRIDYYRALLASPHRQALEAHFGKQLFASAEVSINTFRPEIMEELQAVNKLSSEFTQLRGGAEIELDGETYNLSSIAPLEQVADREKRKAASTAKWDWFAKHRERFEDIYAEMVRLRTSMAHTLNYDNYVGLGYANMNRTDYGPEEVANFRRQVRAYIVPIAQELYERQRQRLGVERLRFYDLGFRFPDGNPKPQGNPAEIVAHADRMYREMSEETGNFFRYLQNNKLMDLEAKAGKAPGGYCTYINEHQAPYIFSNFNGTSHDIDVLTHEFGHAFQVYSSRDQRPMEYNWPTYDAAEIHSMSMEFFTYPWMEGFFGKDTQKYYFSHVAGSFRFLPYGCAVDEFQHRVYENPELDNAGRNAIWKEMEAKYLPHLDYADNAHLSDGTFWQSQGHIFSVPFYYIDYCLAQICAFQFALKDEKDHASAWDDYVRLCRAGGSKSFLQLVELANLENPFEDGVVKRIADRMRERLALAPSPGYASGAPTPDTAGERGATR
jgi:M3 family oligoendopeptidase